jgi:hypothetical protein
MPMMQNLLRDNIKENEAIIDAGTEVSLEAIKGKTNYMLVFHHQTKR